MLRSTKILGDCFGTVTAGAAFVGSALRGARVFHPQGELYAAEVRRAESADPVAMRLAENLEGQALIRFSAALWKRRNASPEILGVAVRCGWQPADPYETLGVQDLLFITSKRFVSIPVALATTDPHDFLNNNYYSILPFHTAAGALEFRLVPQAGPPMQGDSRDERLAHAAASGQAGFVLQQRSAARRPRLHSKARWQPVVTIRLTAPQALDDRELLFSPFHADRGIEPAGVANRMRRLTYRASKAGRSVTNRTTRRQGC